MRNEATYQGDRRREGRSNSDVRVVPSHFVLFGEHYLRLLAVLFIALLLGSCARFPAGTGGTGTARLIFEMEMDGAINPNFVYIVAMNPSTEDNPTTEGPIPVIAPPWGNGFVEGGVTHFVRWDTSQSPHFLIFRFRDAQLIEFFETGVPVNFLEVEPGERIIRFEIELTQIATDLAEAQTFRTLQVNFLTMDNVPQGTSGDKVWDALGDG